MEGGGGPCSMDGFCKTVIIFTAFVLFRMAEVFYSMAVARGVTLEAGIKVEDFLTYSRRALGLFQHHDGITGTAKEVVVNDYAVK